MYLVRQFNAELARIEHIFIEQSLKRMVEKNGINESGSPNLVFIQEFWFQEDFIIFGQRN